MVLPALDEQTGFLPLGRFGVELADIKALYPAYRGLRRMPSTVDGDHGPLSGTGFSSSPSTTRLVFCSIANVRVCFCILGTSGRSSRSTPDRAEASARNDAPVLNAA